MKTIKNTIVIVISAIVAFFLLTKKSVINSVVDENSIRDKILEEDIKKDLEEMREEEETLKKGVEDKSSEDELAYWKNENK